MKKKALVVLLLVVMLVGTFATFSYGAEKKTGLYKEDGQWKYYEDGQFKEVTGLVQKPNNGTWHYVENGVYKKVTGLVQCVQPGKSKGKWYYVVKGDLNKDATGLVQCVQPGSSNGKWYYVVNGKLDKKAIGLVQCIQPGSSSKGKWYFVWQGKQSKSTGAATCIQPGQSEGKMYFVKNGKLSKEAAIACPMVGAIPIPKYYFENGKIKKVTKLFTGMNYGLDRGGVEGTYYVSNGNWDDQFNGIREIDGKEIAIYGGTYYPDLSGILTDAQGNLDMYMVENGELKRYTGTIYAAISYGEFQGELTEMVAEFKVENGVVEKANPPVQVNKQPYWENPSLETICCISNYTGEDHYSYLCRLK